MKKSLLLVTSYLLLVTFLSGCTQKAKQKEVRFLMGTIVEVVSADPAAADIVFNEIKRIENILSKYREDSDVSLLNKSGSIMPSQELFFIVNKAKEFWQLSNGAFDITVAPLMDLWGFTNRQFRLPGEQEIKNTLKLIGSDKIILNEKKKELTFKEKGMKIDLGAIAKGYAVDCAVEKLKKAGIKSALINAGGDIYCLGDKDGKPWQVAIQNPRGKGFVKNLELKDRAVATSGDYEQFFETGGKRYSHIFNPKTGRPSEEKVISVTVVANDCLTADALATTIFVLGRQKAAELLKKFPGVEVEITE